MNQDRFEGNCKQLLGKIKEQWGKLTNNPQCAFTGLCEQRTGIIQERNGILKDESELQLKEFLRRNRNWDLWVK